MTPTKCEQCGDENPHSWVLRVGASPDGPFRRFCGACAAREKKAAVAQLKVVRRERIPLRVGTTTLVGTIGFLSPVGPCAKCGHDHVAAPHCSRYGDGRIVCEVNSCGGRVPAADPFPLGHGNCGSIGGPASADHPERRYYACRNMNMENVGEAAKRWPELALGVECEILEDESCRVIDERIPAAWRRHFCSGCGYFEDDEAEARFLAQRPPPDGPVGLSGSTELGSGYFFAPYVATYTPPRLRPDADEIPLGGD